MSHCVYVHMCLCVYVCEPLYICVYVFMCICVYEPLCIYVCEPLCICLYVFMCICVCEPLCFVSAEAKRGSDPPEGRHSPCEPHLGSGSGTQILCKNRRTLFCWVFISSPFCFYIPIKVSFSSILSSLLPIHSSSSVSLQMRVGSLNRCQNSKRFFFLDFIF